jgi:CDP-paratose 2-epimerase
MKKGPVVVFGGAGFIGANLAHRLLTSGEPVRIFDNLSRPGVERNLEWLRDLHDGRFELRIGDVRDSEAVEGAVTNATAVYHFAAQVAVTTSLSNPVHDFSVNARGTLNILEAVRKSRDAVPLVFTSTNKVYGAVAHAPLYEGPKRYEPIDRDLFSTGFSESTPLQFCSPYGCSKGAADQYVLDYAKSFGLRALVLRMSCIYGPRQFGNEDQGWVAHFVKRSLTCEPIAIYGNGKQVRDLLFIDDLVDALLLSREHVDRLAGQPFNLGGGIANSVSLLELVDLLEELSGERTDLVFSEERVGDQRYYVSDTRRFASQTGWSPKTSVREGLRELHLWLSLPYEKRRMILAAAESAS